MAITGGRRRGRNRRRSPARTLSGFVALTGSPGTGKSAVRRVLRSRFAARELANEAVRLRCGVRRGRSVELSLPRLARALAREPAPSLLAGHLAHLLPIRDVVVLRCRPDRLEARLARARRGSTDQRRGNAVAEATDLILLEALDLGRNIFEVDTTDRTPRSVAREVERWLDGPRRPRFGSVDWLSDARVTEHLLRGTR